MSEGDLVQTVIVKHNFEIKVKDQDHTKVHEFVWHTVK